jgi:hypothetical protein
MNSIAMAMALETRRPARRAHEHERYRHRKRGNEHQQKDAQGTQPIVLVQARSPGRVRQPFQPLAQRFQFRRRQTDATTDGKRVAITR